MHSCRCRINDERCGSAEYIGFLDDVNPLILNDFDSSDDDSDLLIADSVPWTDDNRSSSSGGHLET